MARVYENYLQVIVRDAAPCDGSQTSGTTGLDRAARLGRRGDERGAVRGGRPAAVGWTCCNYRLKEGLARLADGGMDALVWSGGVPTPAIADLDAKVPLRMLDIGQLAAPMSQLAGYPYLVRQVPAGEYVPPGMRSIGVPDLLLCRHGIGADMVAAVVDVLATDAPQLVPPYVRGLQYLDPPSMIQTGLVPLHPGAVECLPQAARLTLGELVRGLGDQVPMAFRCSASKNASAQSPRAGRACPSRWCPTPRQRCVQRQLAGQSSRRGPIARRSGCVHPNFNARLAASEVLTELAGGQRGSRNAGCAVRGR